MGADFQRRAVEVARVVVGIMIGADKADARCEVGIVADLDAVDRLDVAVGRIAGKVALPRLTRSGQITCEVKWTGQGTRVFCRRIHFQNLSWQ